jgi:putative transcriptional regulator
MVPTITNSVSEYRKKHNLSQQQLADNVELSRKTISAIETGRFTPSVAIALKLAQYFNESVEALFMLEDR